MTSIAVSGKARAPYCRFHGALYRLAQEPEENPKLQTALKTAKGVLDQYGVLVGNAKLTQEGDGYDLTYPLALPSNIPGLVTFDFNLKSDVPVLQEIVAEICKVGYVGNDKRSMAQLLQSLGTLCAMKAPAQEAPAGGRDKKQIQARTWLEYYGAPILAKVADWAKQKGTELQLENRAQVLQAIAQATAENENALGNAAAIKQAVYYIKVLDDDAWKLYIQYLENSRGQFTPARKLVTKRVQDLTKHEKYNGEPTIMGYDKDRVFVAVDVPPPVEGLIFVFERAPGQPNVLRLVTGGMALCGHKIIGTGPDEALAKRMVTAMVDLVLLSKNAANPEYSRIPSETGEAIFSDSDWDKINKSGIVIYHFQDGKYRVYTTKTPGIVVDKGRQYTDCMTEEQYDKMWENVLFKSAVNSASDVAIVEPNGDVHLVNKEDGREGAVVYRVENFNSRACG